MCKTVARIVLALDAKARLFDEFHDFGSCEKACVGGVACKNRGQATHEQVYAKMPVGVVGHVEYDVASAHAGKFSKDKQRIRDVLENLHAEHEVERAVFKGQGVVEVSHARVNAVALGGFNGHGRKVDSGSGVVWKMGQQKAGSASGVEEGGGGRKVRDEP